MNGEFGFRRPSCIVFDDHGSPGLLHPWDSLHFCTPSGELPANAPTNRRMNMVCNAAWQAGTALAVIDGVDPDGINGGIGIHERLAGDPPDDGNADQIPPEQEVDDWRLMAG